MLKFNLVIPTYNSGLLWKEWINRYHAQTLKADSVLIIDSSSTDQTVTLSENAGFSVYKIEQSAFNHGGTRNLAAEMVGDCDILVFMTQDALLASPNALEKLLQPFINTEVAAVCGRQLPHREANPIAAHARLFNYPAKSSVKSRRDIDKLGIKVAFMSNSFAAYRKSVFKELGGFPQDTIFAEDMYLSAKIILASYQVAYCAEAQVHHSHNYTLKEEFQRYFDIGVFHQREQWIQQDFGTVNSEGKKFVISEFLFLLKNSPFWIFRMLVATFLKWLGYKLGFYYKSIPLYVCRKLSMNKGFWSYSKFK